MIVRGGGDFVGGRDLLGARSGQGRLTEYDAKMLGYRQATQHFWRHAEAQGASMAK